MAIFYCLTAVGWVILLFLIREVSPSNLTPDTGYHDSGFSYFPQFLQANADIVKGKVVPVLN
jgi:hypothetical protein